MCVIQTQIIACKWHGQHGYIAQWLERLTADQQVPGSNPGVPFDLVNRVGARGVVNLEMDFESITVATRSHCQLIVHAQKIVTTFPRIRLAQWVERKRS